MDIQLVAKRQDDKAQSNGELLLLLSFPESRIKDLLCCGFEGGVGYWCEVLNYKFGAGLSVADFKEGGKMQDPDNYFHPTEIIPFAKGCAVICRETSDDEPNENPELRLDRAALNRGLGIMFGNPKLAHHAADFLKEDEDAGTGDVFIQCCLLGEVVYG